MSECKLYDELNSIRSGIVGCSASGKQGKSAFIHTVANCVPNLARRPKYLYEKADVDLSVFPGYQVVDKFDDVPVGSVLIIEDLIRSFSSRGSGNNSLLPRWLGLISQKDIVVMYTVQNLMDTDLSIFRLQNFIEVHKIMYDEDLKFERPEFRIQQTIANHAIRSKAADNPDHDIRSMVYSPRYHEVSSWPLVEWWSDRCAYYLAYAKVDG